MFYKINYHDSFLVLDDSERRFVKEYTPAPYCYSKITELNIMIEEMRQDMSNIIFRVIWYAMDPNYLFLVTNGEEILLIRQFCDCVTVAEQLHGPMKESFDLEDSYSVLLDRGSQRREYKDSIKRFKVTIKSLYLKHFDSLEKKDLETLFKFEKMKTLSRYHVYNTYTVFILMSVLTIPHFCASQDIRLSTCTGKLMDVKKYSYLFEHSTKSVRLTEHWYQWYRVFSLGTLTKDIKHIIIEFILRLTQKDYDMHLVTICTYCSQNHQTQYCQYMNSIKCLRCDAFIPYELPHKRLCGDCKSELTAEELEHSSHLTDCETCGLLTYKCYNRCPCCPCDYFTHGIKFHRREKHICSICHDVGHLEKSCNQKCICSHKYWHSMYDCPLAVTDNFPFHKKKSNIIEKFNK